MRRCLMEARDAAEVADQVRFLAGTLFKTLKPVAAVVCKTVRSGFNSHRRLWERCEWLV